MGFWARVFTGCLLDHDDYRERDGQGRRHV